MRDWLTKDFWWKLFSVVLAVVIWVTVHNVRDEPAALGAAVEGVTLTYDNLPVQIVATASDVHYFRVLPDTVKVKVSGVPAVIAVLQANQVHPVVNLTDAAAAGNLKQRVEVSMPPGVTLVTVEPAEVAVLLPLKVENKK